MLKMRSIIILVICFTAGIEVSAVPKRVYAAQRIVGGTVTTVSKWPQLANVMFTWNWSTFEQFCGGTILNNRTILTAAHCIISHPANRFRFRVGSALASSGGVTDNVASTILHPCYNTLTEDNDIALLRSASPILFTDQVQPARIASIDYNLADNQPVFGVGWGADMLHGPRSEELRQVQYWTINQNDCARHYCIENIVITDNMLCAGSFDIGGRDQCQGDNGGPLFHKGVVVGVYSFGINCGVHFYPSVSVRISRVSAWINENK